MSKQLKNTWNSQEKRSHHKWEVPHSIPNGKIRAQRPYFLVTGHKMEHKHAPILKEMKEEIEPMAIKERPWRRQTFKRTK